MMEELGGGGVHLVDALKTPVWCNFGVPHIHPSPASPARCRSQLAGAESPAPQPKRCGLKGEQGWGQGDGVPEPLELPKQPPPPPPLQHPPGAAVTSPRRLSRGRGGPRQPGGGGSRAGTSHTRAVNNHPALPPSPGPANPLSPRPRLSPVCVSCPPAPPPAIPLRGPPL